MTRKIGDSAWIDVSSHDLVAVKNFYTELFGWTFEQLGEEFGSYNIIRNGDALVGGAMDVSGMTCPMGQSIPSAWSVYLTVDDLDARLEKAAEHGATVAMAAEDIGDSGRMAMIVDPTGSPISMWQPRNLGGYDFTGQPGSPVWFELMTHKFDDAVSFYKSVFDAELVPMTEPMEDSSFRYVTNGGEDKASWGLGDATGVMPEDAGGWRIYLGVESCDEAVEKIGKLGGRLLDGPVDSPFGRIATVADPDGASFQICAMSEAVPEG